MNLLASSFRFSTSHNCLQCQKKDWKVHKKMCAVWKDDIAEAMRVTENTRRAEMSGLLNGMGFQTVNA